MFYPRTTGARPADKLVNGPTSFTFVTDGIQGALARAQAMAGDRAVNVMGAETKVVSNIAGYLRTLESVHLTAEHPARHRRGAAIALWHIAKVAEVRDRALRLVAEHDASPGVARVPLSTWPAERLLRDDPRTPE
jgi:hypothetical protein